MLTPLLAAAQQPTGQNQLSTAQSEPESGADEPTTSSARTEGADPEPDPKMETIEVRARRAAAYQADLASVATKTATDVMELPQSVQVVPLRALEDQLAQNVAGILKNVSGVQHSGTDRRGMVRQFTARGFRLNPGRNFYLDGRPFVFAVPPAVETIERLEFVKGPASVLYGQAEPGGVVNLVLKQPTARTFAKARAQVGSFSRYQASADAGGPIGDTWGYRANASYLNSGGFRDFAFVKRYLLASKFTFRPNAWLDLDVNGSYQDRSQNADSGLAWGADVPRHRSFNEPWARVDAGAANLGYRVRLRLSDEGSRHGGWTLRHTASWQRQILDERRADPLAVQQHDTADTKRGAVPRLLRARNTQRLTMYAETNLLGRFETGGIEHQLLVGADVFRSIYGFTVMRPAYDTVDPLNIYNPKYSVRPPQGFASGVMRLNRSTLTQAGAYIQDQLTAFEWLHALVGARIDSFGDTLEESRIDTGGDKTVDQGRTGATFRGGVVANPFEVQSLFVSYAQGFRPNIDPFFNSQLPPERSAQWELGSKLQLLDDRLLVTFSGYLLTKTNVSIINPVSQSLAIAGERRARGWELDVAGDIAPGWSLIAGLARLDARIVAGDPRPLSEPGVGTVDLTGNVPPASPAFSGNLWTTYRFRGGALDALRFGFGAVGRTRVQVDMGNRGQLAGYTRFDAMAGWSTYLPAGHELDLQLNVENLTNAMYLDGTVFNFLMPAAPFSVLAQASVRMGARRGRP